MNTMHEIYTSLVEVTNDLSQSSYKEEMMKQSDLFYIVYFWISMENHTLSKDIITDEVFRRLHLRHPVFRNLAWKYLDVLRSEYLFPIIK